MFKINTRSNKFYLDAKNGGFYVNKNNSVTLGTYSRSVFYGADKWSLLADPPVSLTASLGLVGISWSTNSSWSNLSSFGAVVDYSPGYWTLNFLNGDYIYNLTSNSLSFRDDGYGLNYIGYTDIINYWLAQVGLGNHLKLLIDGGSFQGIFRFSGVALTPGFRARMVLQEITNDDGTYLNPFVYYVFEFKTDQQGIDIADDFSDGEADNNPDLQNFLTDPTNCDWGCISLSYRSAGNY